jgi:hypothetical protein
MQQVVIILFLTLITSICGCTKNKESKQDFFAITQDGSIGFLSISHFQLAT